MQCLDCKHSYIKYGCAKYFNGIQISTSSFTVYECSFWLCPIYIKTQFRKLFNFYNKVEGCSR